MVKMVFSGSEANNNHTLELLELSQVYFSVPAIMTFLVGTIVSTQGQGAILWLKQVHHTITSNTHDHKTNHKDGNEIFFHDIIGTFRNMPTLYL